MWQNGTIRGQFTLLSRCVLCASDWFEQNWIGVYSLQFVLLTEDVYVMIWLGIFKKE